MNMAMLIPILLPMLAGVLVMWCKPLRKRGARQVFVGIVLALNAVLVGVLVFQPDLRWEVHRFTGDLVILLKTDGLSRVFAGLTSVIWLLVGVYAFEYIRHEANEERFFLFYLLTLGSLMGLSFAGNYMTLYLFFELMTLASMPMVLHSMTREAVAAALKYLFYSIAGASLALTGFFVMLQYGSIEFAAGGTLDAAAAGGQNTLLLVAAMLTIIGFCTKAGMFPMHSWLPTAHPVAPAPASAVLSGVITKAGVLAVIRVVFYQFGADLLRGTWVQYTWISLCLVTVVMGSMLAFKEQQLKKRLAYSSVSQVSYILFGLSLLTAAGMVGAMLHLVFHSVIKNGLFMVAGAMIYKTHKTHVGQLRGIGKEMPATMWCFTLLSVALIGIPPTSGFVSKWHLATGSLAAGTGFLSWLGPVALLLSALLTAGYLLSVSIKGFIPGDSYGYAALEKRETGALMLVPLILLAALAVLLGILPEPLVSFFSGITGGLF